MASNYLKQVAQDLANRGVSSPNRLDAWLHRDPNVDPDPVYREGYYSESTPVTPVTSTAPVTPAQPGQSLRVNEGERKAGVYK